MIGTRRGRPDRRHHVAALIVAASAVPAAPVLAAMAAGVLVALVGHLAGSRRVAALGIAVLFLATAAMIVAAFVAYRDDPGDPRPPAPRGGF